MVPMSGRIAFQRDTQFQPSRNMWSMSTHWSILFAGRGGEKAGARTKKKDEGNQDRPVIREQG